MRTHPIRLGLFLGLAILLSIRAMPARAQAVDEGWIDLTGSGNLDAWKPPTGAWTFVGDVQLDPNNPKKLIPVDPGYIPLVAQEGDSKKLVPKPGALYNGPTGKTNNLMTKANYGDLEAHVEFLIPKGSNSGVKFGGVYEIQILDTHGKAKLTGSDCGGIYPRAEGKPKYHYLDEGQPPRVNAALPAGQWQTLDIAFRAPRFAPDGRKVANARFVKVVLNGQLIHVDAEAVTPTGNNWVKQETPTGPFLIQADHGPTAIRNVRIRPLASEPR